MTDFMTALQLILVQFTCPGDQRAKGVQLQSTCNLCRESHKTQVWLCFLVVSFFCVSTCIAYANDTTSVLYCLKLLEKRIKQSDTMLYAPPVDETSKDNCVQALLKCYMLELKMVLNEEAIENPCADTIFEFDSEERESFNGCPACEEYALKNITIFLDRLTTILEKINSKGIE